VGAALALAGSVSAATQGRGGLAISPGRAFQGEAVRVTAPCDHASNSAIVRSETFDMQTASLRGGNRLVIRPTIKDRIPPGAYAITVTCQSGHEVHGVVMVLSSRSDYPYGDPMADDGAHPALFPWAAGFALLGAVGLAALRKARSRGHSKPPPPRRP
jgi:hypothetical protein